MRIFLLTLLFSTAVFSSDGLNFGLEIGQERVQTFYTNESEGIEDTQNFTGIRGVFSLGYNLGILQPELKAGILNGTAKYSTEKCKQSSSIPDKCESDLQALIAGAAIRIGNDFVSIGPTIEALSTGEKRYLGELKLGGIELGNHEDSQRLSLKFYAGQQESTNGSKSNYVGTSAAITL